MTFKDMTVEKVTRSHARAVEDYTTRIETMDAERQERRARSTRVVDGVPVHRMLGDLCEATRKVHRDVKFAVYRNGKSVWVDGDPVMCEIWAYFEGDQYAFMRLGYADYSVRNGDGNKFGVYSRLIRNQKFGDDREQHHMAMADTLERAIKNVKAYTRRYTPKEIAAMTLHDFQTKVSTAGWDASSGYREAYNNVTSHATFMSEMRALVMNNYQFNDPLFGEKVRIMVEKHNEQQAQADVQHHGYWVQARQYLGEQVFDVLTVYDVKRVHIRGLGDHKTVKGHELDSVDENLASRIAALSMLTDGVFVEGLGHKINDSMYWVLK